MAKKKKKAPRNPLVKPMRERHPRADKMKDKRTPKGGQRNKQKDILEDNS
jgi:hypothetical protein